MSRQASHSSKKSTSSKRVTISCRVKESEPGLVKLAALTEGADTADHANSSGVGCRTTGDTRSPLFNLLFNTYLCCVYGYSMYYMIFDEQGSQFERMFQAPLQKFTPFRFLTINTLILQLISSALHLVALVIPKSQPIRDLVFTVFGFPLSCLVAFSFWIVYATKGREYIYPVILEDYLPLWLNHVIHTMILPASLGLAYMTNHKHYKCGPALLFIYLSAYFGYLIFIKQVTGIFPYYFMDHMCSASLIIYMGTSLFSALAFYQIGYHLNRFMHPKRPDTVGAATATANAKLQPPSSGASTPALSPVSL